MSFSSTNNKGNIKPTVGITLSGLFLLLILALFLFPAQSFANPGKTTTCLDCHTTDNSDPSISTTGTGTSMIYVAVDGVEHDTTPLPVSNYVLSSYTGAAQDVEIDYYYTGMTPSGESVSLWVNVPAGWPIAPGTVNSPTGNNFGANWSSAWDVATSNGGGAGETYYAVATGDPTYFPNSPDSYSIYWHSFSGSAWDVGNNAGAYDDGVGGNPGDQDGWADKMGTDFKVTVPAGLSPGTTYEIVLLGIGHQGAARAHVVTTLTIEIPSGATTTTTTLPPTTTTTTTLPGTTTTTTTTSTTTTTTLPDTTEPSSTITAPLDSAVLNSASPDPYTISGTASDNNIVSLVEVSIGGGPWQTATDTSGGTWATWSFSWTLPADGSYTIKSRVTDGSSNQEGAGVGNAGITVTVDRAAPTSNITDPTNGATLNSASNDPYTISGDALDTGGGTVTLVEVSIDGGPWQSATGSTSWTYSWTLPSDGFHTIESRATDSNGNVETPSAGNTVTVDRTPPTFAGVQSANDAASGGAVDLTWNTATEATSPPVTYNIYVSISTPVPTASAYATSSNATGDTVTGLTNDTPYYFLVRAEDSAGNEDSNNFELGPVTPSAPASCAPNPPSVSIVTADKEITFDGGMVKYTVRVTNNDSIECSSTPFILNVVDTNTTNFYPSTADINPLSVSPQSFAETTIRVTAKPNQTNGLTNATHFYTSDGNHADSANSNSVTTTINVTGVGCVTDGSIVNGNGDQLIMSR